MSTDRDGRPLTDYPVEGEFGRLVGITVFGTAAYADGEQARVALLGDDGDLRCRHATPGSPTGSRTTTSG